MKVSLTKSMTLAIRMAEMAIATHLTTSARMVMRPIFKELNIFEQELRELKPDEINIKKTLTPSITVRVSFDYNDQTVHMACFCAMQPNLGNTDWRPDYVNLCDEKGETLEIFHFNQAERII